MSLLLDIAFPIRYNPAHGHDGGATADRPRPSTSASCGAPPRATASPTDGNPSLLGVSAQDRSHPVVCGHLLRAVGGIADLFGRRVEMRGARSAARLGFFPSVCLWPVP